MTEMLIVQWAVLIIVATYQLARTGINVFHPATIYIVFHAIIFVLRPTLLQIYGVTANFRYMGYFPSESVQFTTLFITDVGLVSFVLFANSRRSDGPLFRSQGRPIEHHDLFNKSLLITSILFLPISIGATAYLFSHPIVTNALEGAANATRLTRDVRSGANLFTDGGTAYVLYAQYLAAPVTLAIAYVNRFRLVACLPLAIYMGARMAQGAGRFSFFLLLIAAGLAFIAQRRKQFVHFRVIAITLVGFIAFSAIGVDRDFAKRLILGEDAVPIVVRQTDRDPVFNTLVGGPDLANFEFLTYVVHFVPEYSNSYTYFTQYADILVKPIPRAIWPEKPARNLFQLVTLSDFGNFWGLTISLVGDGWMSFGWLGVIATMALAGAISSKAYRSFAKRDATISTLAYCIFASLMPQWFRDGGTTVVEFLVFHTLPLLFWSMLYRGMVRRRELFDAPAQTLGWSATSRISAPPQQPLWPRPHQ